MIIGVVLVRLIGNLLRVLAFSKLQFTMATREQLIRIHHTIRVSLNKPAMESALVTDGLTACLFGMAFIFGGIPA